MKWDVVWQVDPDEPMSCIERDWFYETMSLVQINSVQIDFAAKPLLTFARAYSIICASCPNQTDQSDLIQYLKRIPKPRVLYHMSDEFVEVGRNLYRHCELVIRNGSAYFDMFNDPQFIQVPLGYVSGLRNGSRAFAKSSRRKCTFAFMGTMKHERETEMLAAFEKMEKPHFVRKTPSFEVATNYFGNSTIAIYKNAVFVPNPKGNWSPECNRLYDALEWGCIPLIKRYPGENYHENYHDKLLGKHPIPTFTDWNAAVEFARELFSDKVALDALQVEVFAWWQKYKSELQIKVAQKIANLAV